MYTERKRLLKASTGSQYQKSEKYCHKEYHEQPSTRLRLTPGNFQIREKCVVHVTPMLGEIRKSKEFGWGNHFGKLYLMDQECEGKILLWLIFRDNCCSVIKMGGTEIQSFCYSDV
jgi:hypothetical protein